MPRKTKDLTSEQSSTPEIPKELLDQFVTGPMTAQAVEALMGKFKKAVIERALSGELPPIWATRREPPSRMRTAIIVMAPAPRQF